MGEQTDVQAAAPGLVQPIRLLFFKPSFALRETMNAVLSEYDDFLLVGGDECLGDETETEAREWPAADLIVARLTGADLERQASVVEELKARQSISKLLIELTQVSDYDLIKLLAFHADGYVSGCCHPDRLALAMKMVAYGDFWLDPKISERLLPAQPGSSGTTETEPALTEAELYVLSRVGEGQSYQQIACELLITDEAVRRHIRNIMVKLVHADWRHSLQSLLRQRTVSETIAFLKNRK